MVQLICLTMRIGQNRCSAAKNDLLMRISFAFVNMSPQLHSMLIFLNFCKFYKILCLLDLVQVRPRRKVGRDGLGTFAAFRMLLAKIGAKICCCCQLASHASIGNIRR
jgi:hypothetical protein